MQETMQGTGVVLPEREAVRPESTLKETPVTSKPNSLRVWLKGIVMIGALIMMYFGQLSIFRNPGDEEIFGSLMMLGIGGLIFVGLLGNTLLQRNKLDIPIVASAVKPEPFRIRPAWLLASLLLAAFASWRSIIKPELATTWEYFLVWIMMMLTLVLAVTPEEGHHTAVDANPLKRWEYVLLILLFVGGMAARGINLGTMPYIMDQDESKFALEGADLIRENFRVTPFEPGVDSHPRIYMLTISMAIKLLGVTLAAARLSAAIAGALGVPALYLLGRELFGWRIGLVAALFMIPWPYHIIFSRLSMNQPFDPLFATLSFYFLLRGIRRGAASDFVLCGIMLGIAQMFWLGGRLAPVAMVSYLVFLSLRERGFFRKQWKFLLLVPIAGVITTLPQNYFLLYYNQPISTRADKSILLNGELDYKIKQGGEELKQYILDQIRFSFGGLLTFGDRSGWYGVGSNLMGPIGGPLLLLGVLVSLVMLWYDPKWCLPFGWALLILIVTCMLAISPPQYERYFSAAPALALMVGVGASTVALGISKILNRLQWRNMATIGIGALILAGNTGFFVNDYVPAKTYIANRENWLTNRVTAQALQSWYAKKQVILVGGWEKDIKNTNVVQYFFSDKQYQYIEGDIQDALKPDKIDPTKPATFLVAWQRSADLIAIQNYIPGGTISEVHLDQDGSLAFYVYETPDKANFS